MTEAITFDAIVYKVSTLVDQGLRISFDLPENAIIACAQLMACKREGSILHVTIAIEKQLVSDASKENAIQTRTVRKSSRTP